MPLAPHSPPSLGSSPGYKLGNVPSIYPGNAPLCEHPSLARWLNDLCSKHLRDMPQVRPVTPAPAKYPRPDPGLTHVPTTSHFQKKLAGLPALDLLSRDLPPECIARAYPHNAKQQSNPHRRKQNFAQLPRPNPRKTTHQPGNNRRKENARQAH